MFPFAPLLMPVGGGTFTPFDAPGKAFFYNSENTNLDITNTYVTKLIDVFGVAGDALPTSDPQRAVIHFADPDYNTHPSLTWSNTDDTQYDSPVFSVGAYTFYQVCLLSAASTYALSLSFADYVYNSTSFSLYCGSRADGTGYGAQNASAGWLTSATPIIITRTFDGVMSTSKIRINGVDVSMTDLSSGNPATTPAVNTWVTLMNYFAGGFAPDGSWAATAFYTAVHSSTVISKLETYFSTYYAI